MSKSIKSSREQIYQILTARKITLAGQIEKTNFILLKMSYNDLHGIIIWANPFEMCQYKQSFLSFTLFNHF